MKPIQPPLRFGDRSPEVANLQEGLLLLLRRQIIRLSDEERGVLEQGLLREQQEQNYNEYTAKLIFTFQEQSGLPTTVEVDGATAEALNRVLRDLGEVVDPSTCDTEKLRGCL